MGGTVLQGAGRREGKDGVWKGVICASVMHKFSYTKERCDTVAPFLLNLGNIVAYFQISSFSQPAGKPIARTSIEG